jgi:predicted nucleic acid-binding protein
MRVVIDTNVLVSVTLRDRGPERVVLAVVERADLEWVFPTGVGMDRVACLFDTTTLLPY